jgi:hypothetical protein
MSPYKHPRSTFSLFLIAMMFAISAGCAQTQAPELRSGFEKCLAQGGMVLKSYPPQCIDKQGNRFIDETAEKVPLRACMDKCGDAKCDELVCMMQGCPCAETPESCSLDCKP